MWSLVGGAVSYALLVYTHLISAFMMGLFLIAWLPFHCGLSVKKLTGPFLALVCGAGLAAPALIPAVAEKSHANIDWVKEMPNGDFRINFIFSDEVLPGLGFKDPVKPPVRRAAHSQLILAGVAAFAALAAAARMGQRRRDIAGLAGASVAAYLLQTPVATPVWIAVPNLATIQFPWRFQAMQVLASALLAALALAPAERGARTSRPAMFFWALAAAGVWNLGLAWQNAYLKPYDFDAEDLRNPGVEAWVEPAFTPKEFKGYRRFRETRLTVARAEFSQGTGEATVDEWTSSGRRVSVKSESGGTVTLGSFWFPGWTATLDGERIPVTPSAEYGLQTISVPAGAHTLALRFESTPARRGASWIALFFLVATPAAGWFVRPRRDAAAAEGAVT